MFTEINGNLYVSEECFGIFFVQKYGTELDLTNWTININEVITINTIKHYAVISTKTKAPVKANKALKQEMRNTR